MIATLPKEGIAMDAHDPRKHGFSNARLLLVVSDLSRRIAKKTAELGYGAWNPDFCAADASEEARTFFCDLCETIDRYAAQAEAAAQGIEAGTAATVKQGAVHESPVGNADAP